MDEKMIPQVRVGIMNEPQVEFVLNGDYRVNGAVCSGDQIACCIDGMVEWNGTRYGELLFEPVDAEKASFTLKAVTIGVSFHWKRQEDQTFKGALHLIVENGKLTPVNVLSVEDYLLSVISSEMSANASLELLKAHAVISRSWLRRVCRRPLPALPGHYPCYDREGGAGHPRHVGPGAHARRRTV